MNRVGLPILALGMLILGVGPLDAAPLASQRAPSVRQQKKIVEEFLKQDGWTSVGRQRRESLLTELMLVPPLGERQQKSWIKTIGKLWSKGPQLEKSSGRAYLWEEEERGLYIVGGNMSNPKGLLIAMHGGGVGSGDAGPAASSWARPANAHDLLLIAPQVLEKTERGWTDSGTEEFVMQLIERACRTWDIDPERVYLAGHSMGGYGSWTLGAHHADRVAGLAPSAGAPTAWTGPSGKLEGIVEGVIPNLFNVPIRIYQSADDVQVPPEANRFAVKALEAAKAYYGGFDFEYWEVTDRGHRAPPGGYEVLFDKVADKLRVARPKQLVWQPTLTWKRDFYWLRWDTPMINRVLVAKLDREKNEVHIELPGATVQGLHVWLDSSTLDVKKPVRVLVNQKEAWSGQPVATLQALLRSTERGDAGHLYPYLITLDK
ncbi:MAG: putative esterase [Planctomycetota bacterium]|jgi:predicted esterase